MVVSNYEAQDGVQFVIRQVPRPQAGLVFPSFKLPEGARARAWSGATRSVKNSLRSIAPVILAALALPGFRSVIIWPNNDDARLSTSSALGHSLPCRGTSVGNTRR